MARPEIQPIPAQTSEVEKTKTKIFKEMRRVVSLGLPPFLALSFVGCEPQEQAKEQVIDQAAEKGDSFFRKLGVTNPFLQENLLNKEEKLEEANWGITLTEVSIEGKKEWWWGIGGEVLATSVDLKTNSKYLLILTTPFENITLSGDVNWGPLFEKKEMIKRGQLDSWTIEGPLMVILRVPPSEKIELDKKIDFFGSFSSENEFQKMLSTLKEMDKSHPPRPPLVDTILMVRFIGIPSR